MAKIVEIQQVRRGGSTEVPKPVKRRVKATPKPRATPRAAPRWAITGVKAGGKATRVVGGAAGVVVLAIGKFSLTRVAPWTSVLAVRIFAGDGKFRALSALTLACNATRVKNVLARVSGRSGGAPIIASGVDGGKNGGKNAAATAAVLTVAKTISTTQSSSSARHVAVIARALDTLEDKVPMLFSPFIRRFATPVALVHLSPRILGALAPGGATSPAPPPFIFLVTRCAASLRVC